MQHKLFITIFTTLFCFAFTASGQKLVNSPYARFNLGTMEPVASFRSLGMGGISIALRDNSNILFSNPASYSSLDTNSFIFDFGMDYSKNIISNGVTHYASDDANFDHLLMGFPIMKGWGAAVGIIPMSSGYYKLTQATSPGDPGYDPITGSYASYHSGSGGFSNFFLGTGLKITRNFSAGINMTVLFGQINRLNQFDFADFMNVYNNSVTENLRLDGVNFAYGLQYSASLKNNQFFNAGISLNSANHYNSNYKHLAIRYTAYGAKDTISYISENSKSAYIPGTLSMGISYGKKNKFTTGIDYVTTKWSASVIPGATGTAADTRTFLFGAEIIPDKFSNYSFLKRMDYRIGGHIGDNYLIINGEQLKEYGASIGIGIPLRRSLSKTNLFFDFTRKAGTSGSILPVENYYTVGISLNIYDPYWFGKRKYD
jgi:hypothetical protein